jgi:hypothetical protein
MSIQRPPPDTHTRTNDNVGEARREHRKAHRHAVVALASHNDRRVNAEIGPPVNLESVAGLARRYALMSSERRKSRRVRVNIGKFEIHSPNMRKRQKRSTDISLNTYTVKTSNGKRTHR